MFSLRKSIRPDYHLMTNNQLLLRFTKDFTRDLAIRWNLKDLVQNSIVHQLVHKPTCEQINVTTHNVSRGLHITKIHILRAIVRNAFMHSVFPLF